MMCGRSTLFSKNMSEQELSCKILNEEIIPNASMSSSCKNLIMRLIEKNKEKRLGAKGIEEIISHPWLKNINWRSLYLQKIKVP